jgi:hypothetical protein
MTIYTRSLALLMGCIVVASLGLMLLDRPRAAPKVVLKAPIHAPPADSRIWYSAGASPQLSLPDGRHEVVRSILNITKALPFGSFVWDEDQVPQGPLWVRIDLAQQTLSVFRNGHEIGFTVILYGAGSKPTPIGSFNILEKRADYYSHSYDAPMPYMLRLTKDGVAIHGSDVREGWATHGCIGVPLEFARLLFGAAHKGDLVVILPAQLAGRKV